MRIVFICGSFEPGRDGVGDYVRRLSEKLIGQGHHIAVAAINDKHITTIINHPSSSGEEIAVQRLPLNLSDKERFSLLKSFIDDFNPDWISLQFVSFSFHPKGLVFGLAKNLLYAGKGRKWHIMFHELWVGMTEERSRKEAVWGMMQRELIRDLIKKIKPSVIHTHTRLYQKQLEKFDARTILLPLFSNIPVMDSGQVNQKIAKGITAADPLRIVIFGGIHRGAPVKELAHEAVAYGKAKSVDLELVIVGRNGKEQQQWADEWTAAGLKVTQMGEQDAAKVSEILTGTSFGIFTTPIALVEKSGSVAAMREHGNHLLCVSQRWSPIGIELENNPFGIIDYKEGNLEHFFSVKPDFSYMPTLSGVAEQFIANLMTK
jgi:hypothetical protein